MKMYNSTKQYLSIWLKYDEHSIMANLYSVKLAIAKKSKISDKTLNLLSNVDTEMEFDYLLGRYFFANKNYNEAIKMFNRVLSVLSDCQVKPWEGILSPYNYGHKLSPAKIDMYYKLALSHYKLKNYKDSYKYSSLLMRYGFKIGKEFYIYQKSRKKITGVDNKKVFYSNKYICLTIFVKIYNIFFGVNKKLIFRYYFFKSYFNNRKQYS